MPLRIVLRTQDVKKKTPAIRMKRDRVPKVPRVIGLIKHLALGNWSFAGFTKPNMLSDNALEN